MPSNRTVLIAATCSVTVLVIAVAGYYYRYNNWRRKRSSSRSTSTRSNNNNNSVQAKSEAIVQENFSFSFSSLESEIHQKDISGDNKSESFNSPITITPSLVAKEKYSPTSSLIESNFESFIATDEVDSIFFSDFDLLELISNTDSNQNDSIRKDKPMHLKNSESFTFQANLTGSRGDSCQNLTTIDSTLDVEEASNLNMNQSTHHQNEIDEIFSKKLIDIDLNESNSSEDMGCSFDHDSTASLTPPSNDESNKTRSDSLLKRQSDSSTETIEQHEHVATNDGKNFLKLLNNETQNQNIAQNNETSNITEDNKHSGVDFIVDGDKVSGGIDGGNVSQKSSLDNNNEDNNKCHANQQQQQSLSLENIDVSKSGDHLSSCNAIEIGVGGGSSSSLKKDDDVIENNKDTKQKTLLQQPQQPPQEIKRKSQHLEPSFPHPSTVLATKNFNQTFAQVLSKKLVAQENPNNHCNKNSSNSVEMIKPKPNEQPSSKNEKLNKQQPSYLDAVNNKNHHQYGDDQGSDSGTGSCHDASSFQATNHLEQEQQNFDLTSYKQKSDESTLNNLSILDVPDDQLIQYNFEIPYHLCGKLIGSKGRFINTVKQSTNTHMAVADFKESIKICTIIGSKSSVKLALNEVRKRFPLDHYPNLTLDHVALIRPTPTIPLSQACQLHLPIGVMTEVVLSCTINPGHFFLQQPTHPTYPKLSHLDQAMTENYSTSDAPSIPQIYQGIICAAEMAQGWFRALVKDIHETGDECDIMFVDYGGYAFNVPVSSLRQIRYDFMSLPFQAAECYLANVLPINNNSSQQQQPQTIAEWSQEANKYFEELAGGHIIYANIQGFADDNVPYVNLFKLIDGSTQFLSINEELVSKKFAQYV